MAHRPSEDSERRGQTEVREWQDLIEKSSTFLHEDGSLVCGSKEATRRGIAAIRS
jgi:hypothetical protein